MATIDSNRPPTPLEVETFLGNISLKLPKGFIEFYKETNGADISGAEAWVVLWPLTKLIHLNNAYNVQKFAPEFFLFGSDGGDTAYAIEKETGNIFEMPFIGMSKEDAVFKCNTFNEFIESFNN